MTDPSSARLPMDVIGALTRMVHELFPNLEKFPETEEEVLALSGADREEAREYLGRLRELLPTIAEEPQRPPPTPLIQVVQTVTEFLMTHPGSACQKGGRFKATGMFRRFILGLTAPGQPGEGMSAAELAYATGVPLEMLENWLRKAAKAAQRRPR